MKIYELRISTLNENYRKFFLEKREAETIAENYSMDGVENKIKCYDEPEIIELNFELSLSGILELLNENFETF